MPEDQWKKARQKDAAKKAAREAASGQPSSFERLSKDVKPIDKMGLPNADLRDRKCIRPHELRPARPDTSPKRRRVQRRLRRQGRFPEEALLDKALETQLAYNELLASLKQKCRRWAATHPKCRTPFILRDRDRLDIEALRDAYADAYRIVDYLARMAQRRRRA